MTDQDHHITPEAMKILTSYPNIFGPGPWPVSKTMLGWGFTCGDGWYPLLDRLFADIDQIRDEDGLKKPEVIQVKQKLGELRVYVRGGNDRVQTRLRQAEEEAFFICEGCGGPFPGNPTGFGPGSTADDDGVAVQSDGGHRISNPGRPPRNREQVIPMGR